MEARIMIRLVLVVLLLTVAISAQAGSSFTVTVDAGDGHGHVRRHFVYPACGGDNVSPRVHWTHAPHGARGFALTVFDPDANHGKGWWHWFVIDLPATATALQEGASPRAPAHSLRNDFGTRGWGGPCPPVGDGPHHYVFTLYALDTATLGLPANVTPAAALEAVHAHTLRRASTTFVYAR
ncbi:YbhB/YbcL family Raf kinase inhibitor-like protein [Oleiagrimonas citrea]